MSLWTPGGEIPVNRRRVEEPAAPPPPAEGAAGVVGGPTLEDLSPEEREQAKQIIAQMAEVQEQIAATPAEQLVANHLMGLYEVAAIKLAAEPPRFRDAQLAIDAMAGSLEQVADRLGPDGTTLREALRQLQMAFVQLRNERSNAAGS